MHNSAKFAAVLATAALAYVPYRCGVCAEDLVLGAALSATGIYATNGNNTKNGCRQENQRRRRHQADRGKCYHLKIKYYDDEFERQRRAAQLVERLIDQDQVLSSCSAHMGRR